MARKFVIAGLAALLATSAMAQYFGKNKVRYDTFDWQEYSTPHFRISFYDRVEPNLAKIASFAESAYDELARKLNFQLTEPVPLITYATHSEFEQTNVIVNFISEGIGAFAVPARNRMVLPVDLPDADLQQLIQHELTHIFQYEILFQGKLGKAIASRPPQWFMEGMASYMALDEDAKARAVMRDAVLADRVPSVNDPVSGYFSYRFGHKVFEFVEAEWGVEGLRDFIFEFRNTLGGSVERALERAFDLDIEEFDARFRAWLRKHYQDAAVERGDPREFGPAFRAEEDASSAEVSPAAAPSGDLIAAFSTVKNDVDVVLFGVPNRRLFRNLTRGNTTFYDYLVAQGFTVGPDRGRDLAFSPDGDTVAVFGRRGRGRVLLLLDALHGGIAREYEVSLDQAMQPAFSPDGKTIAFHAFAKGKGDIFLLDVATGAVRNLTDDDAYDSSPTFSPDGRAIVYSSQSGEVAKLFEIDVADPGRRRQLTSGPGNDEGASFSVDGKRLYFASDRDAGILDIYSVALEDGELNRLTSVIGAATNPIAVPTRDGERVIYQAYTKGRYQLYLTDPAQGTPAGTEQAAEESPARPGYTPPVTVTISPDKISPVKRHKLFADDVQVLVGVNTDQSLLAQTYLSFSDQYGDRRVGLLLESVSGYSNFRLTYANLKGRLQWGASVFDDRSYYLGYDASSGYVEQGEQVYRQTGGSLFVQYPVSTYHRLEGSVGYIDRVVDYPVTVSTPAGPAIAYREIKDQIPFVTLGLTGDTSLWRSYGPHAGSRWQFAFVHAQDLNNGGSLSDELRFDGRRYVPLSDRNELALRLWAATARGNRPSIFYFGGLDTLRGYDYSSFAGNHAAFLNAEWRFPLIDHMVLPWLYIPNIRGRVFLDVGAAWFDSPSYEQEFTFMDGGQLVDGVSSYGFGLSATLFGLPMHWDFAKRWDFEESDGGGYYTTFWIGFRY
jgi:hypothetical protein